MRYCAIIHDPRDPTGEHRLVVAYVITVRGVAPTFDDPGYPSEYELIEARNKRDRCVLPVLTPTECLALENAVHEEQARG